MNDSRTIRESLRSSSVSLPTSRTRAEGKGRERKGREEGAQLFIIRHLGNARASINVMMPLRGSGFAA